MTHPDLVFGWRTALLTVVSGQVLLLAGALLGAARNLTANRSLAALLVVIVGMLTPFTIGFAGFYDAWPWLTFAPFAVPLALGPLVYAYASALVTGVPPRRLVLHMAPAAVQFVYQAVCFALPMPIKLAWDTHIHAPWIHPAANVAAIASLAVYAVFALRLLNRYRIALGEVVADDQRYAARWLRNILVAVLVVLVAEAVYQAWETVFGSLSYFDVFGLYLIFSALALYLAVEGWRHADRRFPRLEDTAPVPDVAGRPKDWRALGERWAARTRTEAWWREPELTLADLAARLGVNTHHLSRGLNEGLGMNFAGLINGLRAQAVADALTEGRREDLLTMALDAGFSSKASFNRAFLSVFGVTPSAYRRALDVSKSKHSAPDAKVRRVAG